MKNAVRFICLLLFLIASIASARTVEIPDPALREAIREELQLPPNTPITQQDMAQLDKLRVPSMEIADLTGLKYAINLDFIGAWDNPISDLTPLANLTQLRGLNLGGCQVSDITPLANLIKLEALTLGGNFIVDISPLANLTQLKKLRIDSTWIIDFTPLDGLSLDLLERDYHCELPHLPIEKRIQNRTFPSVFAAWSGDELIHLPQLSTTEALAHHDLQWSNPFRLRFIEAPEGRRGYMIEESQAIRDELLILNPNMLSFVNVHVRGAPFRTYPEDFPYWFRDENGNRRKPPRGRRFLTDFTQPGMQDIIVANAVAVAKCGLFDGIFFDWFGEDGEVLVDEHPPYEGFYSLEEEQRAKDTILQRIREAVRDDFLIIINTGRSKIPRRAWGINGTFMETLRDNQWDLNVDPNEEPYTHEGLKEIESTLLWAEENLREPQVNCLEGWGIPTEPPDSPNNLRFMRVFTTMSLTLSDGYVLYITGPVHEHMWYDFWNANLGYPIGPKAQRYGDIEGLYIREFTNGWAVYNRSGKEQAITLPRISTGVSSTKQDITHLLPDLDGEIYLRKGKPFDLNRDGTVNVLDLILVSQQFGTLHGDINGDGTTDILDLILVAQQFKGS